MREKKYLVIGCGGAKRYQDEHAHDHQLGWESVCRVQDEFKPTYPCWYRDKTLDPGKYHLIFCEGMGRLNSDEFKNARVELHDEGFVYADRSSPFMDMVTDDNVAIESFVKEALYSGPIIIIPGMPSSTFHGASEKSIMTDDLIKVIALSMSKGSSIKTEVLRDRTAKYEYFLRWYRGKTEDLTVEQQCCLMATTLIESYQQDRNSRRIRNYLDDKKYEQTINKLISEIDGLSGNLATSEDVDDILNQFDSVMQNTQAIKKAHRHTFTLFHGISHHDKIITFSNTLQQVENLLLYAKTLIANKSLGLEAQRSP